MIIRSYWFKRWVLYALLILSCLEGIAQTTLNAPIGGTNYQWFHNENLITGEVSNSYVASFPGTYYATFTGTNNCEQTTSYFILVDNCNIGNEVDLVIEPACTYDNIIWSNGGTGISTTVTATNISTEYTASINISDIYAATYNFNVIQFDTACCTVNNSGTISLIPSNKN